MIGMQNNIEYDEAYRDGFVDAIQTIRELIYQGYEADLLEDWIEQKLEANE